MARQLGAVRFIGRLANTVGYKARDGKGDAFDAMREHTVDVANPQTLAQMSQRMKLTPVQNFYRGLAGLLDHSWQGVKYGNPSRLHFYSLALRALSTAGCPYVNKGEKQFIPWNFPISEGSIAAQVELSDVNGTTSVTLPQLAGEDLQNATVGRFSEAATKIFGIKAGQQLTFVFVFAQNSAYSPYYCRVTINPNDETPISNTGIVFSLTEGKTTVSPYNVAADDFYDMNIVAAGVIVSELVGSVWQRNTTSLVIAESLRTTFNSQAAFDAMLASYRTSNGSNESDWYLNGGEGDEGSSTVSVVKEATVTTSSGDKVIGYYKVGATKYAPYYEAILQQQPMLCGYRKGGDYAFTKAQGMVLAAGPIDEETQSEYLALGYTLCTRAELLALAPELTIPE